MYPVTRYYGGIAVEKHGEAVLKKRKILRLSAVFLFALTAAFASVLCVNADTDVPSNCLYTIVPNVS